MWWMGLFVFAKKDIANLMRNVQVRSIPTGIGKIIGNKGGIAVTFTIRGTSYCMVGCHLAAKPFNTDLRIYNNYEILHKIRLGNERM